MPAIFVYLACISAVKCKTTRLYYKSWDHRRKYWWRRPLTTTTLLVTMSTSSTLTENTSAYTLTMMSMWQYLYCCCLQNWNYFQRKEAQLTNDQKSEDHDALHGWGFRRLRRRRREQWWRLKALELLLLTVETALFILWSLIRSCKLSLSLSTRINMTTSLLTIIVLPAT